MDVLTTTVNTGDPVYQGNFAHMSAQLAELRNRVTTAQAGGGAAAVEKHTGRGKLFVQERIEALLDEGSPFLEFSTLAANGLYD
ncbi:hypothetical protein ACE4Z7_24525, partial [Salmonella enterica]